MLDLEAEILLPDGGTILAGDVKTSVTLADMFGNPQTVKRRKTTSEKEYHYLKFENGKSLITLPYLSILTWEDQIDANNLEPGDKVLGFKNGELCEIKVADSLPITIYNKKHLGMPKKVKMLFFESYEDMPFVANEVVIGLRKQLRLIDLEPYFKERKDYK